MAKSNQPEQPQKPALSSPFPIVDKPWVRQFPTPSIKDYIVSVRKDTRQSEFKMPKKGDAYDGADQQEYLPERFEFATAQPVEQMPGMVDLYYLAPFKAQEEYNFTVEYPYVDKNYPRFTRTYVVLRGDDVTKKEPSADTIDPVFGNPFVLSDHKIERFTDNTIFDAVFVKVTRIYERLPGPVITTFENNQFQQLVAVASQEVVKSAPPAQNAISEQMKQERTGTAKARNTLSKVDTVFPNPTRVIEIPSMTRELWLGGFIETTFEQIQAGQIDVAPTLSPGQYAVTETQQTLYKKKVTLKALPLPQTRDHKEITDKFGGGVLTEEILIAASGLTLNDNDDYYAIVDARLRNLPGFGQIRMIKSLDGTLWPKLYDLKTDEVTGIRIGITKQVLPALPGAFNIPDPGPAPSTLEPADWLSGYVENQALEKWRTIQIVSKVQLPLPPPVTWGSTHRVVIPPTLLGVDGVWGHFGGPSLNFVDGDITAKVTASYLSGVHGAPKIRIKDGFSGDARCRIVQIFTVGPPSPSQVGVPFKIAASSGTVIVLGLKELLTNEAGGDSSASPAVTLGGYTNDGEIIASVHEINNVLTAGIDTTLTEPIPTDFIEGSVTDSNGQDYEASAGSALSSGKMVISIPASSPIAYPTYEYLAEVQVERWRFGIFVTHSIFVTLP